MGLRTYLAKRALNTIILVVFVIVLNFIIFEIMPGSQGSIDLIASNPKLTQAQKALLLAREEERFGLRCGTDPNTGAPITCPVWTKFERYFVQMITFQFGSSFQTGNPVIQDAVGSGRLVNTLLLLGTSSVIAIIVGIFIGVVAARRRGSIFDSTMVTGALTTYSLPTFWMGLVFIFVFAFTLGWFPPGGAVPPTWADPRLAPKDIWTYIIGRMQHLFLPAAVLTLFFYGGFLLLTRATMIEALSEDYITTARAKGLPERTVLYKHALKNASLPLVTAAALQFGFLLSGAIITETVFNYDGLGKWLFDAIGNKDGPVMQAMFYIIALCVIIANFASDLIYGLIDPRIKYE
jgi:peptide/nickel transport system permease protein